MTMAAQLPRFSGLRDPILGAQATFRSVMSAMANPGRIEEVPASADMPDPLAMSLATIALTLIDHDTPVYLDPAFAREREIAASLSFHTGCRFVEAPSVAAFALIGDPEKCPELSHFSQGSLEYPDRSTTLLLQVASLGNEGAFRLNGPGIHGSRSFVAAPLPRRLCEELRANHERFPQGVDLIFCCGSRLAALPRSTRIAKRGASCTSR